MTATRLSLAVLGLCVLLGHAAVYAGPPGGQLSSPESQKNQKNVSPPPSPIPPLPPECGPTSGCRLSLRVRTETGWDWATVKLNAEEQTSFDKALQEATKGQRFMSVRTGKTGLEFVVEDSKPAETQPLFKLERGEKLDIVERFRVVPKGQSYQLLKERAGTD